jgi:hypothetical protein
VGVIRMHVGAKALSLLGSEDLPHEQQFSTSEADICEHVRGYVSGKREIKLRKRPGSDRVGYGLKVPRMPRRRKLAYRGSCLVRE